MITEARDTVMGVVAGVLLAALMLLALGCHPLPPPAPIPPPDPTDPWDSRITCADVCRHEADLGCEAARPTAAGASCVEVCGNVQASGVVRWALGCRARAATCAAIDRCETR